MSKRFAIISIGTNSTRLLLADVAPAMARVETARSVGTRIGEGLGEQGRLGDEPMQRTLEAIGQFQRAVKGHYIRLFAVATSARLALYGGGSYLRDRLTKEPATPEDLAKAVDSLATTLENLAVNYLADVPGFVQDPLRHNLDGQLVDVEGRCK